MLAVSKFYIAPTLNVKPVGIVHLPANYSSTLDVSNPWRIVGNGYIREEVLLLFDEGPVTFSLQGDVDHNIVLEHCMNCYFKHGLACPGPLKTYTNRHKCKAGNTLNYQPIQVTVDMPAHAITIGLAGSPAIYSIHPELSNNIALLRPLRLASTAASGAFLLNTFQAPLNREMIEDVYIQGGMYQGTKFMEITYSVPHSNDALDTYSYPRINTSNYPAWLRETKQREQERYNNPPYVYDMTVVFDSDYCYMFKEEDNFTEGHLVSTNTGLDVVLIDKNKNNKAYSIHKGEYIEYL